MRFPAVTASYAALLGLVFAALSAWVVVGRGQFAIHHGDGGNERLNRRIRSHGNFAEYVPLILMLTALLESRGEDPLIIHALLGMLLVARIVHPMGMLAPVASPRQYLLRATSSTATWLLLIAASALLLLRPNGA